MDTNILKGNWNTLKGKIKEQWGKLTDDDLNRIEGKKDQLIGKLQKTYGYTKEEAEKKVSSFEKSHLDNHQNCLKNFKGVWL